MTTQDIQSLTAILCNLITYELEITQALETSDQEVSGFLDFRHDLAYAVSQAIARNASIDPETDPTQDQEATDTDTPPWLKVVGPKVSAKVLALDGTSEDLDLQSPPDTQPTQQETATND